jgi:hypothetical protein
VIKFLVQKSGEVIADEGSEDEDVSQQDEIAEDYEGLQDDDYYFFVERLVLIITKMHSGLAVMVRRGGSMVDV